MDVKRIAFAGTVLGAAGLLGGCAVYSEYPPAYGYPGAPVVYGSGAPVVVAPPPVYVAPPPVYYGPAISLGIFGRSGHRHHHGNRDGHGHQHRHGQRR